MRIGRWSEPSVVIVFQLVEVIREEDANKTSDELGAALLDSLVGVSQFRMPKSVLQIASAKFFLLVSVDVTCKDEWCALKSPSTRVSAGSSTDDLLKADIQLCRNLLGEYRCWRCSALYFPTFLPKWSVLLGGDQIESLHGDWGCCLLVEVDRLVNEDQ